MLCNGTSYYRDDSTSPRTGSVSIATYSAGKHWYACCSLSGFNFRTRCKSGAKRGVNLRRGGLDRVLAFLQMSKPDANPQSNSTKIALYYLRQYLEVVPTGVNFSLRSATKLSGAGQKSQRRTKRRAKLSNKCSEAYVSPKIRKCKFEQFLHDYRALCVVVSLEKLARYL